MQTFIIGDIHGEYDKLINCLKKVNFDYDNDKLIQLGDVVDRGANSYLCIEELMKIKNLIAIQGNHDECWFESLKNGNASSGMLWKQGAQETYNSYYREELNPEMHFNFFKNQIKYYIDEKRRYFVHGGFNRHHFIYEQPDETVFTWDRDLWASVLSYESMKDKTYGFKIKGKPLEVFIGHTPTLMWGVTTPMNAGQIWNLDTGCGKGGLLTIMNLDTKEYYQN